MKPEISTHRGQQVVVRGRKHVSPIVSGPRRLLAHRLLESLPPPPDEVDWIAPAEKQAPGGDLGMMLNDRLGCHDAQTEVLTADGWQKWPEYSGAQLATMNQVSGELEYQSPRALIRYDYEGPLFYADHAGLDFALTPNHRMYNRPYEIPYPYVPGGGHYGSPGFAEVQSLATRVAIPGTTTGYVGARFEGITIGDRTWSGDDFFALLGLILSDGWAGSTESNRHAVSFCSFVESRRDLVAAFAHRLGIKELPGRRGVWKFSDAALGQWLRANACDEGDFHSVHKRIPRIVQVASAAQIGHFLTFFGDKNHGDVAAEQYFTSSGGMAGDLQELLLKIGKRSSLGTRTREGSSTPAHTLHVRETDREVSIITRGRKAQLAMEMYRGEVFCAEVPNSTLITRRNGKILISGNCCTIADGPAHFTQVWTASNGSMVTVPDGAVLKAYETVDGYVSGDPSTDQGGVETDVLAAWQRGIDGFARIDAWIPVNLMNLDHVRKAIWKFGGVYTGIGLPLSFQDESVWYPDLSEGARAEAGSWGGHAMGIHAYFRDMTFDGITWGRRQKITQDGVLTYCDEGYVPFCAALWCPGGKSPNGDAAADLLKMLQAVA